MISHLDEMTIFVAIAQAGSFSGAARALGVPRSTIGRKIQTLEQRAQLSLIERTTRALRLTEAGQEFLGHCKRVLVEVQRAESTLSRLRERPSGRLRVTIPEDIGRQLVGAQISRFVTACPNVAVDVLTTDAVLNLLTFDCDIALRIGSLPDSGLSARRLGDFSVAVCASPAYLNRRGTPLTASELAQHPCILYGDPTPAASWSLLPPRVQRPELSVVACSNDVATCTALARDGHGVLTIPFIDVVADLRSGLLTQVLTKTPIPGIPLSAVFAGQGLIASKTRHFLDFLARDCQQHAPDGFEPR